MYGTRRKATTVDSVSAVLLVRLRLSCALHQLDRSHKSAAEILTRSFTHYQLLERIQEEYQRNRLCLSIRGRL
jgi:hypothetical protein